MSQRHDHIDLDVEEVHVWHASLDVAEPHRSALASLLSREELERAGRFRFERHRRWFVAGRGLLRRLLGAYLDIRPGDIQFAYGEHGKPRLADNGGKGSLQFNLSHSQSQVAYAVTRRRDVGIDIERDRPLESALDIAEHQFSAREKSLLAHLPVERRHHAFLQAWVRKEAWLKAIGSGLTFPLDQVEVAVDDGALGDVTASPLLSIAGDPRAAAEWSIRDLPEIAGHAAAVAVRGRISACPCRGWDGNELV